MLAGALGIVLFAAGAFILLTRIERIADRLWSPRIAIGQTLSNGEPDTSHSDLIRSRWDELLGAIPPPAAHAGFLDVPQDLAGFFEEDETADPGEKLQLEVSGVEVGGLIDRLNKLIRPPAWQIDTHVLDLKTQMRARLELKRGARSVRVWHAMLPLEKDDTATRATEQDVLDLALFEMIHDISTADDSDKDLHRWKERLGAGVRETGDLEGGAALLAYRTGLLEFRRYYESGNPKQLDSAVESLNKLAGLAPDHGDGLLLLGMVLIESRGESEGEAIQAFDRYIELNEKKTDPKKQKKVQRARLLRAIARMRQYDPRENNRAIAELVVLANELEPVPPAAGTTRTFEVRELLGLTHVQLAHAYALLLAFLRSEPFEQVLGDDRLPVSVRNEVKPVTRDEVDQRIKKIDEAITNPRNKTKGHLDVAEELLGPHWEEEDFPNRDPERSKERLRRLAFEIHLTKGYALHRRAGWTPDASAKGLFSQAIEELRGAARLNPTHYLPVQYLGMVYKEPRYLALDSGKAGQHLQRSIAYLERATKLNPTDYYGHELLAHARLSEAIVRGPVQRTTTTIEEGIKSADKASEHRTWGTAVPLLRAQLLQLQFELANEQGRKDQTAKLDRYLAQAAHARERLFDADEEDPEMEWVGVLVDARRFGLDPADAKFEEARQKLVDRIKALVTRCKDLEKTAWSYEVLHRLAHIRGHAEKLQPSVEGKNTTKDNWLAIALPAVPYL